MADSSRKGLLIVGALVAVAGAILAVVFLWWMPRQERAEAQDQVRDWEKRWSNARACLLGDPPVAADPGDALAIMSLATGLTQAETRCNQGVGNLMRPQGPASPIEAVENAWLAVEAAIPALGDAYLDWISPDFDERDAAIPKLGVAISSLDAAQDQLRRAAGMPALTRTGSAKITRIEVPVKLGVNGRDLHASTARAQAGAVTETQPEAEVTFDVVFTAPSQGRVVSAVVGALPSVPDGSWFANEALVAQVIPSADPTAAPAYIALAGIGAGTERALLLEHVAQTSDPIEHPLALARSTDGGASWTLDADLGIPSGRLGELRLDYANGTVDVVVEVALLLEPHLLHLDATHPLDAPLSEALPGFESFARTCRRGPALWGLWNDQVHRLDGVVHTATAMPPGADRVIDCTGTAALVEEGGLPVVYHRCTAQGCEVAMSGGAYSFGRAAMLDDGTVIYAASRGRLIALWTEGNPDAQYFRLPSPASLQALIAWDGAPHALVTAPEDDHLLSAALR